MKKTVLFIIDFIGFLFFLVSYPIFLLITKITYRKPEVAKDEKV